jgi:hypothetical protein
MKFHVELGLTADGAIDDSRFDALADALYELDAADPDLSDTDLGASLAKGWATVSMTVDAADQAEAGTKALCAARAAIHAMGDGTPGWETSRGTMLVAPADASDRLYATG